MTDTVADPIVVLPGAAHGIPVEEYVQLLRDRLPDHEIRLARTSEQQREAISDAVVATGGAIDADLVRQSEQLRYFACRSAGTNHLPMEELEERNVVVTNGSGVYGVQAAEHAVCSMLMFARRSQYGFRRQEDREWQHYQAAGEVTGSTVTVLGLGSIGQTVVERLQGFDVHTIGARYTPSKGGPTDEVIGFDRDEIQDALSRSDYLVVACPLTDATEGLIDTAELAALPSSAVLVNVARGGIVDTDALVRSLRWNQLRGAALDVTDPEPLDRSHPLWEFENVIITPHMAGSSPKLWERMADILTRNVERIEETGDFDELENIVPT
ncbi:D-2-hydroxyacid dehydrogenase [Halovenus marina]|uniref:D-2-hydroxyacid dehydrogenase n=1 Tax=Halovenus marina TaxID=3396621 RepID=UPI003F576557